MAEKTLFIDTNSLARKKSDEGEFVEILNGPLAGAKNVLGALRWVEPGKQFRADPIDQHQLIYLMKGQGQICLEGNNYEVRKGAGVYLGPSETASIRAADNAGLKLFHLVVPRIPKQK
ncbi:MAG TPA: AraC family ligand binding domain-containing protein [Bryobacteraceae bacterium]|nr:AraC family ligand binding domain-containing protein [Bryobacteraceae bacterium]